MQHHQTGRSLRLPGEVGLAMARIVREQYPSRLEERQINATLLLYAQVIDIRRDRPWRQWKGMLNLALMLSMVILPIYLGRFYKLFLMLKF